MTRTNTVKETKKNTNTLMIPRRNTIRKMTCFVKDLLSRAVVVGTKPLTLTRQKDQKPLQHPRGIQPNFSLFFLLKIYLLTRAVVVETKQMVVVLAVTEVNEEVVVQNFGWKMMSQKKNTFNNFLFFVSRNIS